MLFDLLSTNCWYMATTHCSFLLSFYYYSNNRKWYRVCLWGSLLALVQYIFFANANSAENLLDVPANPLSTRQPFHQCSRNVGRELRRRRNCIYWGTSHIGHHTKRHQNTPEIVKHCCDIYYSATLFHFLFLISQFISVDCNPAPAVNQLSRIAHYC